ncbi:MAG: helix-turn-helix domain-containing protein [Evtepia sp.]
MNVLDKIRMQMSEWGVSEYQLSKLSGVPQSTINSLFRKNNVPTIPTLEKICGVFEMSLAEFFAEGTKISELTPEQVIMFEKWSNLREKQKEILFRLIEEMK